MYTLVLMALLGKTFVLYNAFSSVPFVSNYDWHDINFYEPPNGCSHLELASLLYLDSWIYSDATLGV